MSNDDIVQCLGNQVAPAAIEPHRVDIAAEKGQCLLSGEIMRCHPVLQGLSDGDR